MTAWHLHQPVADWFTGLWHPYGQSKTAAPLKGMVSTQTCWTLVSVGSILLCLANTIDHGWLDTLQAEITPRTVLHHLNRKTE